MVVEVKANQCQVVMVGCGAPNRGMGWYHAVQMVEGKCPSAALCYIVEPWFLGPGESRWCWLAGWSLYCHFVACLAVVFHQCDGTLSCPRRHHRHRTECYS